jgi:hypothetical protein
VPAVAGQHLEQLVKDLSHDQFAVREKATKGLFELGDLAEPALEKILAKPPTLEARRRALTILKKIAQTAPKNFQMLRSIEALEHTRTPAAQELLEELSRGAPTARLTREAAAALDRLARLGAKQP